MKISVISSFSTLNFFCVTIFKSTHDFLNSCLFHFFIISTYKYTRRIYEYAKNTSYKDFLNNFLWKVQKIHFNTYIHWFST